MKTQNAGLSVRAAARRFTALALALALCFLSACAGGKSSETGPESKTPYTDDVDLTFDITPVSYPYRLAEEEYGGEPLRLTEEALAASGSAVGEEAYGRYAFFSDGTTVNASLLWLPPEKQTFVFCRIKDLEKQELLQGFTPIPAE